MTKYICTSGTSIGGDPMRDNDINAYRSAIADRVRQFREQHDVGEFLAKVSAETNSLSRAGLQANDQVIFLCTDTEDGVACAEAVAEVLTQDVGVQTEICRLNEFGLWVGSSHAENAESILEQEKQQQLQQIRALEQERNQIQEQVATQGRELEQAHRERDEGIAATRRECEQTMAEQVSRQREAAQAEVSRLRQELEQAKKAQEDHAATQGRELEQARRERDEGIAAARRESEQAMVEEVNRQRETAQAEVSRLKQDLEQAKKAQEAICERIPPWHRRLGAVFSPSLWFETKPKPRA